MQRGKAARAGADGLRSYARHQVHPLDTTMQPCLGSEFVPSHLRPARLAAVNDPSDARYNTFPADVVGTSVTIADTDCSHTKAIEAECAEHISDQPQLTIDKPVTSADPQTAVARTDIKPNGSPSTTAPERHNPFSVSQALPAQRSDRNCNPFLAAPLQVSPLVLTNLTESLPYFRNWRL